jgi:hypothetical protein
MIHVSGLFNAIASLQCDRGLISDVIILEAIAQVKIKGHS